MRDILFSVYHPNSEKLMKDEFKVNRTPLILILFYTL